MGDRSFRKRVQRTEGRGRTTKSREEKCKRVYDYLVQETRAGREIPNLTELSKSVFTDFHITNLMEILYTLSVQGKIIYKRGKVLAVSVPKANAYREREFKFMKNEDNINNVKSNTPIADRIIKEAKEKTVVKQYSEELNTERYDKAVKDLIADYIKNANITTRDDIVKYIDALMKITDKLKEKLF